MTETITPDTVVLPRYDIRVRRIDGSFLVGTLKEMYTLSETSEFVWRHIDGELSVLALAALLAAEYDVDTDGVYADTVELVTEWHSLKLVALSTTESGT